MMRVVRHRNLVKAKSTDAANSVRAYCSKRGGMKAARRLFAFTLLIGLLRRTLLLAVQPDEMLLSNSAATSLSALCLVSILRSQYFRCTGSMAVARC